MNDLQQLPDRISPAALGWIRLRLRPVLLQAGGFSPSEQTPAGGDVVSNNPLRFSAWPGSDFGVRAPYPSETALSWDEVEHGRLHGLFAGTQGEGVEA